MHALLPKLQAHFPELVFTPGKQFSWSPETREIIYRENAGGHKAAWSLLHETGHALLDHIAYKADFELLQLEIAAWEKAKELASNFNIAIDNDHIENCLDTYRDWLYKRSICPTCTAKCLQQDDFVHYRCWSCHTVWRVSASRFNRAYRRTKSVPRPLVFHLETGF